MKKIVLCSVMFLAIGFSRAHAQQPPALPLLFTEIGHTDTYFYFEILNTNDESVDLDLFYVANTTTYYQVVNQSGTLDQDGDAVVRFPDGASVSAGDRVVVVFGSATDFEADYPTAPAFFVVRDGSSGDDMMVPAFDSSVNETSWDATTGFLVLFFWNEESDLVLDSDYIRFGEDGPGIDKSTIAVDGPDGDETSSEYLQETPVASQEAIAISSDYLSVRLGDEGDEPPSDGNGIAGHDESGENFTETWGFTAVATPGEANQIAFRVTGVVSGPGDGDPMSFVTVNLGQDSVSTDELGQFEFDPVQPGQYELQLTLANYYFEPLQVEVEDQNVFLDLELSAAASLTGTILLDNYTGSLAGTAVQVDELSLSAATDENGSYFMGPFVAGSYTVEISREGYASHVEVFDLLGEAELSVTLYLDQTFDVSGTVTTLDADGSTTAAQVTLVGQGLLDGQVSADVTLTNGRGEFDFTDVPAGVYRFEIEHEDYYPFILDPLPVYQETELSIQLVPLRYLPDVTEEGCSCSLSGRRMPPTSILLLLLLPLLIRRRL